jgi:hypothetical protein
VKIAEQAVAQAKRDEQEEVAAAYQRGEEPKLGKEIDKAEAQLDVALRRRSGLSQAIDDAGNALALAINEHRAEWLETLAEVEEEAARVYEESAKAMLAAYGQMRPAHGGRGWLEQFDLDQARVGRVHNFAGGRLDVHGDRGSKYAGTHRPDELIRLALRAAKREVAAS